MGKCRCSSCCLYLVALSCALYFGGVCLSVSFPKQRVHTEGFSWKELGQGLDHSAPSIVRFIPLNSSVTLLLWHVCISTAQARTECGSRSRDPSGARHFFCKFWHELALVTCHVKTLLLLFHSYYCLYLVHWVSGPGDFECYLFALAGDDIHIQWILAWVMLPRFRWVIYQPRRRGITWHNHRGKFR